MLLSRRTSRWLLLLTMIIMMSFWVDIGFGQTYIVSVLPLESFIYLNGSNNTTTTIYAYDVIDLQGYDITVTYDPDILHLDSYANAGWLIGTSFFYKVNLPGYLRVAFIQFGGNPVNDDGPLLNLTFSGVGYGASDLTIVGAELSDPNGNVTNPAVQNGIVTTTYASTPVIYSSLSGEVSLQGQSVRGGIPVTLQRGLYVGKGPYTSLSLEQPGTNLFFNSVAVDAYPITTAYPYYLNLETGSNKIKGIVVTSNTLSPLVLLAGNVNNADNEINTEDLDLIKTLFDMTAAKIKPGAVLLGDANNDGIVDVRDLALAGGNFGLNGATAYQEWLP